MKNPIGWFDIYVNDIERAVKFYEAVFNVELKDLSNPSNDSMIMKIFPENMEEYGATGAIVQKDDVEAGHNSTIVYFNCEDCAIEESRVVSAGGVIVAPKFSIGNFGFITLCNDTEGNTIGLHSMQ